MNEMIEEHEWLRPFNNKENIEDFSLIIKNLTDIARLLAWLLRHHESGKRALSIASSTGVGAWCSGRSSWWVVAWRWGNIVLLKLRESIYETLQWNLRSDCRTAKCDCLYHTCVWTVGTTFWAQSAKLLCLRFDGRWVFSHVNYSYVKRPTADWRLLAWGQTRAAITGNCRSAEVGRRHWLTYWCVSTIIAEN